MILAVKLREQAARLMDVADDLERAYNPIDNCVDDRTMDDAVSATVQVAAQCLHLVGEHDFNIDDYPVVSNEP